jgi:hypothetical protein
MGDIVYSLPTIQAFGGGDIWLRKSNHYDSLCVLLEEQPYISGVCSELPDKDGYVDLDLYRKVERKAFGKGEFKHLAVCHLEAFDKDFDLEQQWLFNIDPLHIAEVVINRSTRYHDREEINWELLKSYKVAFVGWLHEYEQFCKKAGFKPPFYKCLDALEMARVIKGSKLFVGNQSLGFAIAEALKHPRVLEVFCGNANCIPFGNDGYTHLNERLLERYL